MVQRRVKWSGTTQSRHLSNLTRYRKWRDRRRKNGPKRKGRTERCENEGWRKRKASCYCRRSISKWRLGWHLVFLVTLQIDRSTDKLYILAWFYVPNMSIIWIWNTLKLIFLRLSFLRARYNNKKNKFSSAKLTRVISLIWQHVSTSKVHLQVSSVEYIKF